MSGNGKGHEREGRVSTLYQPLILAGMIGCIATSLVELGRLVFSDWSGAYLVVMSVVASLEAAYSFRLIRQRYRAGDRRLRVRITEVLLLLVLLRAASFIGRPWRAVWAELLAWSRDPAQVLSLEIAFAALVMMGGWTAVTTTLEDLERLDDKPEFHQGLNPERRITARFFWGGLILLIVSGLARVEIANLLQMSHPPVPGILVNVLSYFLLGLLLLGQVRFRRLRQGWRSQKADVAGGISFRWLKSGLIFIGLITLLAFLLPTSYTAGLLETLAAIVEILMMVLITIYRLILTAMNWVIYLVGALLAPLMGRSGGETPRPEPVQIQPETPVDGSVGLPPWFDLARSVLFWALGIGMIVYVMRGYLRDHPEVLTALRRVRLIRVLQSFFRSLWERATGVARAVRDRLPRRDRAPAGQGEAEDRARPMVWRRLSPRDRIQHYYHTILRRAKRLGYPRASSQTPQEYEDVLGPQLEEGEEDLVTLTEAFVEARYSQRAVDDERDRHARRVWRRLQAALRALRTRLRASEDDGKQRDEREAEGAERP